jgi:hypothetical protein
MSCGIGYRTSSRMWALGARARILCGLAFSPVALCVPCGRDFFRPPKKFYGLDLDSSASHRLTEMKRKPAGKKAASGKRTSGKRK